jgi:hypothetical protein
MAEPLLRLTSLHGIDHVIDYDERGIIIDRTVQEADPILDRNKAMQNHNDGYTHSREMRRVASIPLNLIYKWLQEEGWDAFNPQHSDKLAAKLNSEEYRYLRTAPGQLGVLPDGGVR